MARPARVDSETGQVETGFEGYTCGQCPHYKNCEVTDDKTLPECPAREAQRKAEVLLQPVSNANISRVLEDVFSRLISIEKASVAIRRALSNWLEESQTLLSENAETEEFLAAVVDINDLYLFLLARLLEDKIQPYTGDEPLHQTFREFQDVLRTLEKIAVRYGYDEEMESLEDWLDERLAKIPELKAEMKHAQD